MEASVTVSSEAPASKRKPRKRTPRRKLMKRPKRRGAYKPKVSKTESCRDTDLAECISSDGKMVTDSEEQHVSCPEIDGCCDLGSHEVSYLKKEDVLPSPESALTLAYGFQDPLAEESSLLASASGLGSKPSVAIKLRPIAALLSRPGSSLGSFFYSAEDLNQYGNVSSSDVPSPRPKLEVGFTSRPSSLSASRQLSASSVPSDNDFCSVAAPMSISSTEDIPESSQLSTSSHLIECALAKFRSELPSPWVAIAGQKGFHILFIAGRTPKVIQKEVFLSFNGEVSVFVHCVQISLFNDTAPLQKDNSVDFSKSSVDQFCKKGIAVVKLILQHDVCIGANHSESREIWSMIPDTYIDTNPYKEFKYVETCRSMSCVRLIVLGKGKRCQACAKVMKSLRQRKSICHSEQVDLRIPNVYLTHKQALEKLQLQKEVMRKKEKQLAYLKKKKLVQDLLSKEEVDLQSDLKDDFSSVLKETNS